MLTKQAWETPKNQLTKPAVLSFSPNFRRKAETLPVCIFYTMIGGICNKRKMDISFVIGAEKMVTIIRSESESICGTATLKQKAEQK